MNSHPEEESVDEGYDENGYDRPSKSQVKREMHALLDLGKQLIALSPERLKQLPLAERLYEAIRMAQRTTSREGLRRQTHFVGKLMRDAPAEEIRAQLDVWENGSREETAAMHRLETLRDRLLDDDEALTRLLENNPQADVQHLRAVIRAARKEKQANAALLQGQEPQRSSTGRCSRRSRPSSTDSIHDRHDRPARLHRDRNRPNPTHAVIWLHGLGADGNDFAPIVPELDLPAGSKVRFVFPNAPVQPVTINNGMAMRSWYDILVMDLVRVEDGAGIRRSEAEIHKLIARENARGIPVQHRAGRLLAGLRHDAAHRPAPAREAGRHDGPVGLPAAAGHGRGRAPRRQCAHSDLPGPRHFRSGRAAGARPRWPSCSAWAATCAGTPMACRIPCAPRKWPTSRASCAKC